MFLESLTDEMLVERLRQGEDRAFDILYKRYRQKLVATASQRVKDVAVAEELMQDIMTDFWNRRHTIVLQTAFAPYIFTALRYAVLDYLRKLAVKDRYIAEMLHTAQHDVSTPDNSADTEARFQQLESTIESLPDKCRLVFKLSRFENKSIQEISDQLGISSDTTKYHISHAMKVLRTELKHIPLLLWCFFL